MSSIQFKPQTFWFTGLSGAGKSTLATQLEQVLDRLGAPCRILDGDALRRGLCSDLGYTAEDRAENTRRIAEVSKLFNESGVLTIVALISPYRNDRELSRTIIGNDRFCEIHVSTSLKICAKRDPKGLYALAFSGKLPEFTGVSAPYERPFAPALDLDAGAHTVAECRSLLESLVTVRLARRPAIPTPQRHAILPV